MRFGNTLTRILALYVNKRNGHFIAQAFILIKKACHGLPEAYQAAHIGRECESASAASISTRNAR